MSGKLRVGVLFGGKSAEHEVSLQSAKNVIEALDRRKYEVVLIGIDKSGRWYLNDESRYLLHSDDPKRIQLHASPDELALVPGEQERQVVKMAASQDIGALDAVFPVLHGPFGEDGTIQGLLKLANIPFVGAGVLGSAVGMDKDVMKRLLRDAGVPVAAFRVLHRRQREQTSFDALAQALGVPFFIKPANLGSSVGIHKVKSENQFQAALADAFQYDHKVIVETSIRGREIEVSVLGNDDPIASLPGEVVPAHEFYSYDAKYIDEHGAALHIPADVPPHLVKAVQALAIEAFQVLCCEGMARVDLFLTPDEKLYVNEINTIPGFTKISMYPKLWQASGISYSELLDKLIQLAIERHARDARLKTSAE